MIRSTLRLDIELAAHEYTLTLPAPVLRIRFWSLNNLTINVSFTTGEVALGGGFTATSKVPWDSGWMSYNAGLIYYGAVKEGGETLIEIWTSGLVSSLAVPAASFSAGFTDGFDS